MNACHLLHLSLFRGCIILTRVYIFLIFSLNCEQGDTVVSYRQMRGDYKISFTNELKENLWIIWIWQKFTVWKGWFLHRYIISYLHFLNLNNIMTLPKLFLSLRLGLIWHDLCLPCFLPARFRRMGVSLRNQNKCNSSILSPRQIAKLFNLAG